MRLFTTVSRVTCAAVANSASVAALSPISQSNTTLFFDVRPDQRRARVGRRGEIGDGGQDVVVDRDQFGRVARLPSAVSATMNATGSPTWRTAPSASAGVRRARHVGAVAVLHRRGAGQRRRCRRRFRSAAV